MRRSTVVKETMRHFAEEGPTQRELAETKTYLTGSYALRFDSNTKMPTSFSPSSRTISASTISTAATASSRGDARPGQGAGQRISNPDKLIVTVVGKPQGITTSAAQ